MTNHSRLWRDNVYVYPVISRRARGLSIGINLSPSKACTFRCIYCQVNRIETAPTDRVDLGTLIREFNEMCQWAAEGEIWRDEKFARVPQPMRRVNDIAFSGDGEPTAFRSFPAIVQIAADAKARHGLKSTKLVVISNASRFHTQTFRRALPILLSADGEVWAKLDAGSADHFTRVNRTSVPFKRVLANIEWLAQQMPLFIEDSYTASLRGKLSGGNLDAIFIALPFTETDVVTRPVYEEPFVVLMPDDHPLAGEEHIDPAELAQHRVLLMGEGHCFRDQVLEACPGLLEAINDTHTRGSSVLEGSSLETLKHMVASGLGITVLPESAANVAQYGHHRLAVRPFIDPAPRRTVALAWRASYPRHQAIDIIAGVGNGDITGVGHGGRYLIYQGADIHYVGGGDIQSAANQHGRITHRDRTGAHHNHTLG